MIDTVVLTLKNKEFTITRPELFTPNAQFILNNKSQGLIAKQNPSKKELKHGIYKPHLSLCNRLNNLKLYEPMLKIELSLPKLFFGNNFHELRYKDLKTLTNRLIDALKNMGVDVELSALTKASVSSIHYSKNFVFNDGTITYHYINKLKQINLKSSLDVNQTDYRNEGHSFKWHCNSYEIIFYDKLKDLEKAKQSDKRAIEKDNAIQLNIFGTLPSSLNNQFSKNGKAKKLRWTSRQRNKLEILRMEVRLNQRKKIRQLFNKLNIKADLTFKKLYKPAISKKILLHYLDEIESKGSDLINLKTETDKELLSTLIINNPKLKPKSIIQAFGFKKALAFVNIREIRNLFGNSDTKNLNRFLKEMEKINTGNSTNSFNDLRASLEKFKMIRKLFS
jgi:hypothetical protein